MIRKKKRPVVLAKAAWTAALSAFSTYPLFADDLIPAKMSTLMNDILKVFTGSFVKTILIICLCGCAVAYGFNKDNEKMKRNIIAIAVALALVVTASAIVEVVWIAGGGSS
jgi:type IV secretory pathway VirB2 component (pilin)